MDRVELGMIGYRHLWFTMLVSLSQVCAQEPSSNEIWNLLQKSSANDKLKNKDLGLPSTPKDGNDKSSSLELDIFDKIDPLHRTKPAEKIEWDFANLKIDFPKDSGWLAVPLKIENIKIFEDPKKRLSLVITYFPLAKDNRMSDEEILTNLKNSFSAKLNDIPQTVIAKTIGMKLQAGEIDTPGTGRIFACSGQMLNQGGAYVFGIFGKNKNAVREEFTKLTTKISWIDTTRDLRSPALISLSIPGSGLSLDCKDAALISADSEFPNGVAAMKFSSRIEIGAIDIKGIDGRLVDISEVFMRTLAIGENGKFTKEESTWANIPAVIYNPTEPIYLLNSPVNWRIRFAKHNDILCIGMELWSGKDTKPDEQLSAIVAKAVFSNTTEALTPPADQDSRMSAAIFYNQIGLDLFTNGRIGGASAAFEKSFLLNTKDVTPLVNWINSLSKLGRNKEALEALEKHESGFADNHDLKLWKAELLVHNHREKEAVALYEELFKSGLRSQQEIFLWIQTMQSLQMNDRAVEVAEQLFKENGSLIWQRVLANAVWTAGKLEQARSHYDKLGKELGREAGFVSDYTSLLLELQDYNAVLTVISNWGEPDAPNANILFNKGIALMGLGRHKEASVVLAEVDRLIPGNQTVKEYLAQAQAMLGRGTLEGVSGDLTAIEIPKALSSHAKEALEKIHTAEKYPGEAWIIREFIQIWKWTEGSDAKMTCRQVIEISDSPGIQAFSTMTVAFKGYSERVNVNTLNITSPNGETITSFKREDMFVQDEAGALANGNKILTIPVPSLQKGSVIEFVYTKSQLGTEKHFPMTTAGIPESGPLIYGAVAFQGDLKHINFANSERLPPSEMENLRVYEASGLSKQIGSSHIPRFHDWGMLCWASDKRLSWKDEAKTYLAEIQTCLDDSDFAKKAVRDLELAGKEEKEVIRTVVRWMNKNFRYEGLEFGRRARIPAAGGTTLSRGFGDCKDFSVMIRAILREAGIKAELALVNTSGYVREDLPSLDQFDHMVVFLPGSENQILDATMSYFNTPEALSEAAIGTQAFLLESDNPHFITLKDNPKSLRFVEINKKVKVDPENGGVTVNENIKISPELASLLRYAFSTTSEAEHVRTFERLLRQFEQRLKLESVKITNLDNPFLPLDIELHYEISSVFRENDHLISGTAPCPFERWLFEFSHDRDRTLGTELFSTQYLDSKTELIIPEGFEWASTSQDPASLEEPNILASKVARTFDKDKCSIVAHWKTFPAKGGPELYRKIQKANEKMFDDLGTPIRFKKSK